MSRRIAYPILAFVLAATGARAGSVAFQSVSIERAATLAGRIIVGKVTAQGSFHFPGSADAAPQAKGQALGYIQVKVGRVLKGAAGAAGEELRIFSAGEWFAHTHAAAIRGGVVSYADPHYSGKVRPGGIKEGAELIFFLGDEPVPAGFPRGAVFMAFGEAYDRPERERDVVAAVKEGPFAEFDHLIRLKPGQKVRFPDRLELLVKGHSHKRPVTGGPQRETAEVQATKGGISELIELAHVIDPDGKQTWAARKWGDYLIELKGMDGAEETVLVVRKAGRSEQE